ncbi:MAG: helix-turn-helix transcriptional regulator [Dehalococcoidia bacterium]
MNRTDRLMGILLELQARGELRAEDLARHFEVSVRSIYRDVQALCETGVPVVATPGKGYRLLDGYFLPPLSLTADEAAILALGGEFIRQRVDAELQNAARNALAKLVAVLPPSRRAEVERHTRELVFPAYGQAAPGERLRLIRSAIQERKVLRILYHAFRREASEWRDIEPISLVFVGEAWHLAGYCRLRQAPRFFRLDRIDRLRSGSERFERGARHDVAAARRRTVADYPEVRVRFDAEVERWVRERQPFLFQREEFDAGGSVFVYALREEHELLPWLLSWGAAVEVLEPESLRQSLAREALRLFERHVLRAPVRTLTEATVTPPPSVAAALR